MDIQDQLYNRARLLARRDGRTVRSVVEEGLRLCLEANSLRGHEPYVLEDLGVGVASDPNPLEGMSWEELRDEIYGGR